MNSIQTTEARDSSGKTKLIFMSVVIIGLILVFKFLPIASWMSTFLEYIQSLGFWGPVLLTVAYVVAIVFMVPGTILTLGAGFAFGVVTGSIAVSIGSTIGAFVAFLLGRSIGREFVEQKAKENPKFAAVDQAVAQAGLKIVLLTRLSPIFPFNVLNYLFSMTKVKPLDYFLASWIGMMPGTIMYVYFGSAFKSLADIATGKVEGGAAKNILFGVGLVATIAVSVYIGKIAKRAIDQHVPSQS